MIIRIVKKDIGLDENNLYNKLLILIYCIILYVKCILIIKKWSDRVVRCYKLLYFDK